MSRSIAQSVGVVVREGKHRLVQRAPDNSHEAVGGCGGAGARLMAAVPGAAATVLALLVRMMADGLQAPDVELRGRVWSWQAGELPIPLRQRLKPG